MPRNIMSPAESHSEPLGRVKTDASRDFPARVIFDHGLLPLETGSPDRLSFALADPHAPGISSLIYFLAQKPVEWATAPAEEIASQIKTHFGVGADTIHQMMGDTQWQ